MTAHVLVTIGDTSYEYFVPESRVRQFHADARSFGYDPRKIGDDDLFPPTDKVNDLAAQELVGKWIDLDEQASRMFPHVESPARITYVERETWDNHVGSMDSFRIHVTDKDGRGSSGVRHHFSGCTLHNKNGVL